MVLFFLCLLGFSSTAFALTSPAAPDAGSFESLSKAIITVAVSIGLAVLNAFFAQRKDDIERRIRIAIDVAYHFTTNVAKFTDTKVDDKLAYALGVFSRELERQGMVATPALLEQAKVSFGAMHAKEKLALASP